MSKCFVSRIPLVCLRKG